MKKLLLYLLAVMMTFAVSCEKFDDSAIWEKLNSHESRLAALEQLCMQMNTNISSLQQVVEVLQNNDYVTNIAPITEDGKTIGYTITFSKSGSITIYHGKDGKDGSTPIIGVKKYNSTYYWTLNGEWLLDSNGKKIKAEGRDGKNGQNGIDGTNGSNGTNGTNGNDGITPKLKIENEYWYVSYDNGSTWTQVGKATSESSNNNDIITDVTYDDNCVYITLADGTELTVPRYILSQIFYTATARVVPSNNAFGVTIISNEWDSTTGEGVITIGGEIEKIDDYAFQDCDALTGITIPNTVTSIGRDAFYYSASLESITIPNSVTTIGEGAFSGCTSLKSVTLPQGIKLLDTYLFAECTSLESITIPESVESIGSWTFSGCESLKTINIPENVTDIEEGAFEDCTSLESITLSDGISKIKSSVFGGCESLKNIIIPESVFSIGDFAFTGCTSLESITLPNGIENIRDEVFGGCRSLKSITIPNNIESLGHIVFTGCTSLISVTCMNDVPPIIKGDTFENTPSGMKIYVPATAVDDYKTASYWSDYASVIEEIQ